MKALLCLLSDQHVPNLLAIHHYKPDRLVLVETTAMKQRGVSTNLLNALRFGGLDYENRMCPEPLNAEDNVGEIQKTLQAAYGRFPSADWIANVTGGTKPMSIATYEFFKAVGGTIVYTNVSRPNQIIDLVKGTTENCSHQLSIKEFLAGYGFELRKADKKIEEAESRAIKWIESATLLARHCVDKPILQLQDHERKKARDKGITLASDRVNFPNDRLRQLWLADSHSLTLDKYEVKFLTGGWLEVFFWNLLRKHAETLGIWDVQLDLEVGRLGDQSGNEFDVSFMHNFALSMIECKSGSQSHDPGADVLYKIEALIRQFRALRVRSYLATTSSDVLDQEGHVKQHLRNRSEIYNCTILTANDIVQLADESVTSDQIKAVLFGQKSL